MQFSQKIIQLSQEAEAALKPHFDRIDDSFLRAFDISREARVQLITMMMVFGGMVIAAVSRAIMWLYAKKSTMTYIGYILWIFGELLAMATAFTLATLLTDTTRTVTELFKNSFVKTFLIVFIPYALCYIYFIWQENMRELSALRKQIERDETVLQKAYVQILDEKGEMRLSVRRENLLLIESADNYVCVYYLNGDKTKKTMVRNTLENIASSAVPSCFCSSTSSGMASMSVRISSSQTNRRSRSS